MLYPSSAKDKDRTSHLYLILPFYEPASFSQHPFFALFVFFLFNILAIFLILRQYSKKKFYLKYQIGELQENLNILKDENTKEASSFKDLQIKIARYDSLKRVLEQINQSLILDDVSDKLTSIAILLIAEDRGACILYLTDSNSSTGLKLYRSKKENKEIVIKAKEGDIFDFWILRHSTPLLIEDIKRDFRFDLEKIKAQDLRPARSLISSPLISEHSLLGILRLDNSQPNFYTQDDLRFLGTICDLGAVALESSQLFERTQELAIHDSLTSFYTKGYFLDRLNDEIKRYGRKKAAFSLFMLDIDFFKEYNDKFGHTAGDIVLKELGQAISSYLKDYNSVLCRFGGEEFCIIIPNKEKKEAHKLACGLRQVIERQRIVLRRTETNITVSIGVSGFPDDAQDPEVLIRKADEAMYMAKQKGRNQVCFI